MIDKQKLISAFDVPVEVESAARIFSTGISIFKARVNELSQKSVRRVLNALIEFPLHDEKKQLLTHQEEVDLFQMAMELMEAKVLMIEHARKVKEAQTPVTEEKKEE